MYNLLCKKEFGSDTPKWVFNRGGGIPPGHPEISDAESKRVKENLKHKDKENPNENDLLLVNRDLSKEKENINYFRSKETFLSLNLK